MATTADPKEHAMDTYAIRIAFIPEDVAEGLVIEVVLAAVNVLNPVEGWKVEAPDAGLSRDLVIDVIALNEAEAKRTAEVAAGAMKPLVRVAVAMNTVLA